MEVEKQTINILAITHGPLCMDGAGSSWVIHNHYKNQCNETTHYNVVHFRVDPSKAFDTINSKFKDVEPGFFSHVISCDVGYSGKDIQSLIKMFPEIVIIDHHISSLRDIAIFYNPDKKIDTKSIDTIIASQPTLPPNYMYDNDESGATLAWKYFNGDVPAPKTIQYIKDRDIWKFELPDSKKITTGIFEMLEANPDNWSSWDKFIADEDIHLSQALDIGRVICCLNNRRIVELSTKFRQFNYEFGGKIYKGAHLNTTEHISDLGNYVVNMKDADDKFMYDFAVMWRYNENDDVYNCSFRSRNDVDVSDICRKYGGGGHSTAAGMSIANIFEIVNPRKFIREMNAKKYNETLSYINKELDELKNSLVITNINATVLIGGICALCLLDIGLLAWRR
jgi:oligoribonuclease NrnB/cAMP/cGMP phosphodiesterase (DHH superfamily)